MALKDFREWRRERRTRHIDREWPYKLRLNSHRHGELQKYLGLDYYDFSNDELRSPEYRQEFDGAYGFFEGKMKALTVAEWSDGADLLIKRRFLRFNTWFDYSLLYSFSIIDWAYCRNNPHNRFTWKKSAIRFGQNMAAAIAKNPDTALSGFRDFAPAMSKARTKYYPLKTATVLGMIFERADERYYKKYKRQQEAATA